MLVIIGSGLAGYSVAKEWRKTEKTKSLVIITQDDGHYYSKPLLSTAISQSKSSADLVMTSVETLRTQLNATIHTFSSVLNIDPRSRVISVQTPEGVIDLPYSHCVLAMGARPKPFPLLENRKDHYRINSLQDYARFMSDFDQYETLSIIGSGLVGTEFAHDFSHKKIPVQVFTPDPYPLYRFVPEAIGCQLQSVLRDKGIEFHTKVNSFSLEAKTTRAILTAIGLQPNIEIAEKAGIEVNRGIKVDAYLRTSVTDIYALGDCAEIEGKCYQFIAPLLHCAQSLAKTLCDQPTSIALPPMAITLKVGSYPIITLPPCDQEKGEWVIEQKDQDFKALFYNTEEKLCGYSLSGSFREERQQCLARFAAK